MKNDYTKLGGWLLFFMVVSIIVVGANVMSMMTYFSQGWVLEAILLGLLVALLRLCVVVLIVRRNDKARIVYLVEGIYLVLINLFLIFIGGVEMISGITTTVTSVIGYVIWLTYFTKSQRVAVYLHPERAQDTGIGEPAAPPTYDMPQAKAPNDEE